MSQPHPDVRIVPGFDDGQPVLHLDIVPATTPRLPNGLRLCNRFYGHQAAVAEQFASDVQDWIEQIREAAVAKAIQHRAASPGQGGRDPLLDALDLANNLHQAVKERADLRAEIARLTRLNESLAERCAGQSETLTRKAERAAEHDLGEPVG